MNELHYANPHLFDSAARGDETGVQAALAAGANFDAKSCDGRTAAMLAADKDRQSCLGLLIGAGADLDARDRYGWTAAMFATYRGHGCCLRLLIAAHADVDAKDDKGMTAAMLAAAHGRQASLGLLIRAGADLGAQDDRGLTAAMVARSNRHPELASLIERLIFSQKESSEMELAASAAPPARTGRRAARI